MKQITVDCRGFVSRSDLHEALSSALSFPDWYGHNLDALHDRLTDPGTAVRLTLLHWEAAEASLGTYALSARRAILDAQAENPNLQVAFA